MSARSGLLIPDGWRPKPGARVTVLPSKDVPHPPAGVWRVIDRAPTANAWWCQPADDDARSWAKRWPNAITQGCIELSGRVLAPSSSRTEAALAAIGDALGLT